MKKNQQLSFLGDQLRHKLHREGEFVVISMDASQPGLPTISLTDSYPNLPPEQLMIFSKYELGQWLAQPDAVITQDLLKLAGAVSTESFLAQKIMCYNYSGDPTSHILHHFDYKVIEQAITGIALGKSVRKAFEEALSAAPTAGQLAILAKLEIDVKPELDRQHEALKHTSEWISDFRVQAEQYISPVPSNTAAMAHKIANAIPHEMEILLREYPRMNDLSGSIFLCQDVNRFKRGKRAKKSKYIEREGEYMPFDQTFLVGEAKKDHYSGTAPWLSTAIHEVIHHMNKRLARESYMESALSDDLVSEIDLKKITQEVSAKKTIAETYFEEMWDRSNNPSFRGNPDAQSFVGKFQKALFPDGMDHLHGVDREDLLESLLACMSNRFDYVEALDVKAWDTERSKVDPRDEHLARVIDIENEITSELCRADPKISRYDALHRTHEAVALFSPTLAGVAEWYQQVRNNYLDKLRHEQGPLKNVLCHTLPEIPDPAHANDTGRAAIVARPTKAIANEAVGKRK